jgi:N-acetylmuramoyl-L-alanine amidase CwlA
MSYQITEKLIAYNRSGKALNVQGLVIHDTDNEGATAMNHFTYFNGGNRNASAHYFVDWLDTNYIIRTIPESEQAWHVGPTGNSKFLGIELCMAKNAADFQKVWDRGVWLAADILKRHGLGVETMHSHKWVSDTWHESDHQDPVDYFKQYGKTYEQFVAAVASALNGQTPAVTPVAPTYKYIVSQYATELKAFDTQAQAVTYAKQWDHSRVYRSDNRVVLWQSADWFLPAGTLKKGATGAEVQKLQKALNDLGFSCGSVDGSFGNMTYNALVRFQSKNGLTADGIYGQNTRSKMNVLLNG